VRGYRQRIAAIDAAGPRVNSVIELNPDALSIAEELDVDRAAGRVRGPLHGIPVLVKDNIATGDRMQTTAGSLALVGCQPDRDATVAARLRQAGAILLGKTNLSEWANFRGNGASSGWSARGGLTHNPYILDRSASGSSSGSGAAVSASLAAVALGTETDGSILSPSSACGLVGIKPTVGLTSRAGVIPIARSQDTVGPMARTVTDAAITLGALVGPDPRDPVTGESAGRFFRDYTRFLRPGALRGARIGVPRKGFWGFDDVTDAVTEQALRTLRDLGAVLVDAEFPGIDELQESDAEFTVLLYEFKQDVAAYLATLPHRRGCPRNLADLIEFNREHAAAELKYFGQEVFLASQRTDGLDSPVYRRALAEARRRGRADGVDAMLRRHDLQAIVAPTLGPAGRINLDGGESYAAGYTSTVIAISGYPGVTVPMGFVQGLPVGLCFFGTAYSEPSLLGYAYAYEQATTVRRAPRYRATGGPPEPSSAGRAGRTATVG
jgi:amidase